MVALDAVRDVAAPYAGWWAGADVPGIVERYDAGRLQDRLYYRTLRSVQRDGAHVGNDGPEADALWNQYVGLSGALTGLFNDIIHSAVPVRPEPSRRGLPQGAAKLLWLPAIR